MRLLTLLLVWLALFPRTVLAAQETGFWEACRSMMSGMGWMMLPMMIMPLLLIALLVLAILALFKYLKN